MRNNLSARIAPLAALVLAAPLGAQSIPTQSVAANGVSASAENANHRAPIFTGAAYVAPAKKMGFSVQAVGSRISSDEADIESVITANQMQVAGFYGVTNRITVGGYLPYIRVGSEQSAGGVSVDDSQNGLGDIGVFGRFAAYQSKSKQTLVGIAAEIRLATGDSAYTNDEASVQIDAPVSHRLGRWNLHVVPGVQTQKDQDMLMNLNLAGVYSVSERMGVSAELLNTFGGAPSDVDGAEGMQDIDLGAGMRYRFVRSAIDFGLRYNVAQNLPEGADKPSRLGVVLGWNMTF